MWGKVIKKDNLCNNWKRSRNNQSGNKLRGNKKCAESCMEIT